MIDTRWRTKYQKWCIEPLLRSPWVLAAHPHLITFIALFFGVSILFLLANGLIKTALAALIFSGFLDTLDGSLARHKNQASSKGAVIDITSDRLVEFSIIMGLYLVNPEKRALLCLCMLGAILLCITTFLVVGIFQKNSTEKSFYYSPGIMERSEAFIFFAAMILFPYYFAWLAISFIVLVVLTALWRIYEF